MAEGGKRIHILEESEINELYNTPQFTDSQRDTYFDLDESEKALFSGRNEAIINAYRILLLGYLKHKPVILDPTLIDVKADLIYIRDKYKIPLKLTKAELTPTQKSRIYSTILAFGGYELFDEDRHCLTDFVVHLTKQVIEPRAIFDGCIHHLVSRKIAIPAYSTLQKIISVGIHYEERQLEQKLLDQLSKEDFDALKRMASSEEDKPLITKITKLPKGFQQKEMYAEVDVLNKLQDIFPKIRHAVESLELSGKNIDHLGKQVTHYSISRLRDLSDGKFSLYLACYLYQRYFQISDIIIQAFLFHVRKLVAEAQTHAKEKHVGELENMEDKITQASKLVNLWVDDRFNGDVAHSVAREKAYKIMPKNEIPSVGDYMAKIKTDVKKYQWEYYEEKQSRIKNILRKLFLCLDFDSHDETTHPWLKQARLSKQELMAAGKMYTFDARLIKPELKAHLMHPGDSDNNGVNMARAEMLLYIRIKDRIEDLRFFVDQSLSYKWYESDFVPAERVPELISLCNLTTLQKPIKELLDEKAALLEQKRKDVGARIAAGENTSVIFTDINGKKKWSVKQHAKTSKEDPDSYFSKLSQRHIGDVIAQVERDTRFTQALTHRRLQRKPPDLNTIIACIVANGTRFGTHQMAKLCNISYDILRETERNYLRGETLHNAIDLISNAIAKLPIFKYYNIQEDILHASYDGQRLESRFNTLSTHFSSKYFGRGKGLSAVCLSANHVPVNAEIMKPYSHESHYLFDVLHGNTSDIQPDIVSTDTHGTNQFNFAILDCFGWSFAPRYARPGKILLNLFDFVQDKNVGEIVLQKPINYKLIEDNWTFIQQIMMSLDSGEASQANIVRKMSRFNSKSNPFKALAEYDRLIKCIYMLDFIDDSTFRGYVHRALNRGESYHMLLRRIEQVNGKFRGNSDDEIVEWYECSRLIANCIIYFNSWVLSCLLQKFERENQTDRLENVKRCSPVAWAHINFNGSYSFSFDGVHFDINQLLQEMLVG